MILMLFKLKTIFFGDMTEKMIDFHAYIGKLIECQAQK